MTSKSFYLFIFQLLISNSKCDGVRSDLKENTDWQCKNVIDKALLKINLNHLKRNDDNIYIDYQYLDCKTCNLISLAVLNKTNDYSVDFIIDSYYSYKFKVYFSANDVICDTFVMDSLKECGIFSLNNEPKAKSCKFELIKSLNNYRYDLYMYLALVAAFVFIIGTNLTEKAYKTYKKNHNTHNFTSNTDIELGKDDSLTKTMKDQSKSTRLNSLDTFRGLSLAIVRLIILA
jgi:cell division protein FtsL